MKTQGISRIAVAAFAFILSCHAVADHRAPAARPAVGQVSGTDEAPAPAATPTPRRDCPTATAHLTDDAITEFFDRIWECFPTREARDRFLGALGQPSLQRLRARLADWSSAEARRGDVAEEIRFGGYVNAWTNALEDPTEREAIADTALARRIETGAPHERAALVALRDERARRRPAGGQPAAYPLADLRDPNFEREWEAELTSANDVPLTASELAFVRGFATQTPEGRRAFLESLPVAVWGSLSRRLLASAALPGATAAKNFLDDLMNDRAFRDAGFARALANPAQRTALSRADLTTRARELLGRFYELEVERRARPGAERGAAIDTAQAALDRELRDIGTLTGARAAAAPSTAHELAELLHASPASFVAHVATLSADRRADLFREAASDPRAEDVSRFLTLDLPASVAAQGALAAPELRTRETALRAERVRALATICANGGATLGTYQAMRRALAPIDEAQSLVEYRLGLVGQPTAAPLPAPPANRGYFTADERDRFARSLAQLPTAHLDRLAAALREQVATPATLLANEATAYLASVEAALDFHRHAATADEWEREAIERPDAFAGRALTREQLSALASHLYFAEAQAAAAPSCAVPVATALRDARVRLMQRLATFASPGERDLATIFFQSPPADVERFLTDVMGRFAADHEHGFAGLPALLDAFERTRTAMQIAPGAPGGRQGALDAAATRVGEFLARYLEPKLNRIRALAQAGDIAGLVSLRDELRANGLWPAIFLILRGQDTLSPGIHAPVQRLVAGFASEFELMSQLLNPQRAVTARYVGPDGHDWVFPPEYRGAPLRRTSAADFARDATAAVRRFERQLEAFRRGSFFSNLAPMANINEAIRHWWDGNYSSEAEENRAAGEAGMRAAIHDLAALGISPDVLSGLRGRLLAAGREDERRAAGASDQALGAMLLTAVAGGLLARQAVTVLPTASLRRLTAPPLIGGLFNAGFDALYQYARREDAHLNGETPADYDWSRVWRAGAQGAGAGAVFSVLPRPVQAGLAAFGVVNAGGSAAGNLASGNPHEAAVNVAESVLSAWAFRRITLQPPPTRGGPAAPGAGDPPGPGARPSVFSTEMPRAYGGFGSIALRPSAGMNGGALSPAGGTFGFGGATSGGARTGMSGGARAAGGGGTIVATAPAVRVGLPGGQRWGTARLPVTQIPAPAALPAAAPGRAPLTVPAPPPAPHVAGAPAVAPPLPWLGWLAPRVSPAPVRPSALPPAPLTLEEIKHRLAITFPFLSPGDLDALARKVHTALEELAREFPAALDADGVIVGAAEEAFRRLLTVHGLSRPEVDAAVGAFKIPRAGAADGAPIDPESAIDRLAEALVNGWLNVDFLRNLLDYAAPGDAERQRLSDTLWTKVLASLQRRDVTRFTPAQGHLFFYATAVLARSRGERVEPIASFALAAFRTNQPITIRGRNGTVHEGFYGGMIITNSGVRVVLAERGSPTQHTVESLVLPSAEFPEATIYPMRIAHLADTDDARRLRAAASFARSPFHSETPAYNRRVQAAMDLFQAWWSTDAGRHQSLDTLVTRMRAAYGGVDTAENLYRTPGGWRRGWQNVAGYLERFGVTVIQPPPEALVREGDFQFPLEVPGVPRSHWPYVQNGRYVYPDFSSAMRRAYFGALNMHLERFSMLAERLDLMRARRSPDRAEIDRIERAAFDAIHDFGRVAAAFRPFTGGNWGLFGPMIQSLVHRLGYPLEYAGYLDYAFQMGEPGANRDWFYRTIKQAGPRGARFFPETAEAQWAQYAIDENFELRPRLVPRPQLPERPDLAPVPPVAPPPAPVPAAPAVVPPPAPAVVPPPAPAPVPDAPAEAQGAVRRAADLFRRVLGRFW